MLILLMVTGMPPRVLKLEENPPPRKEPVLAGLQLVAARHLSASSSVISQKGFITGLPSLLCRPVPSRDAEPELIKWMIPSLAKPVNLCPVTRWTASGSRMF